MKKAYLVLSALALVGCGDDSMVMFPDTGPVPMTDAGPTIGDCRSPMVVCGSRCVDLDTDPRNCGGCGTTCDSDTFCDRGSCGSSCGSGLAECGSSCVNFGSDPMHCGRCDNACTETEVCVGGSCRCPDGAFDCDGECVDLMTSPSNCGGCGMACEEDEVCEAGDCLKTRESDCDNGIDEDDDGDRDCADSDCLGYTRDCDCDFGGETGEQSCQDTGDFGVCRGCPTPDCSADSPCEDYGFTCVDGSCVFDDTTTFDLEILRVTIASQRTICDGEGVEDWDGFWSTSRAPDLFVELTTGASTDRIPRAGDVTLDSGSFTLDMTSDLDDATQRFVLRGNTAAQFISDFVIRVVEQDIGETLVNVCRFGIDDDEFSGDVEMWNCAGGTDRCSEDPPDPRSNFDVQFRFIEPR